MKDGQRHLGPPDFRDHVGEFPTDRFDSCLELVCWYVLTNLTNLAKVSARGHCTSGTPSHEDGTERSKDS